jgi:hypothetical protein
MSPCGTGSGAAVQPARGQHCGGQRFESPQLHQIVRVSGGGSQGSEISRPDDVQGELGGDIKQFIFADNAISILDQVDEQIEDLRPDCNGLGAT